MRVKILLISFYIFMAIVCYGPATVEYEKSAAIEDKECIERYGKDNICDKTAFTAYAGLAKSIFWPLWLSYEFAENK